MSNETPENLSDEERPGQAVNAGVKPVVHSRRGLNIYIGVVTVTAILMTVALVVYRPFASSVNVFLGAGFLALIWVAGLYPIHMAPKTKVSVTTAAFYAVILVFDPLVAVIVAGIGVAAAQPFIKKNTWINRIFNTSQAILFTGTAALVYSALGTKGVPPLVSAYGALRAVLAAAAMYLVNSVAVSMAAGLQMHRNPAIIWLKGTQQTVVQEVALLAIGLASAMIVKQAPWAIVLMVAPIVVIYYSFNKMAVLNAKVESQLQELKSTQAQLVQAARMASIGTMVAGIAHQINNPMFVIRGRAETLCEDADEHLKTPAARKAIQVILEMADRVSRIVNSLMPNSEVSEDGVSSSDVNEVARNTLLLLESKLLKSHVEVNTALAQGLPPCAGDACEIQEMLTNLVDNACNAMPRGGKLGLTTSETDSGISVSVSDTGVGILPENLAKVFSPFFTTRKGSGGVGLGLYMSKYIAEKYGGSISVDSQVGVSTVFTISLPSRAQKRLQPRHQQKQTRLVASGTGNQLREQ